MHAMLSFIIDVFISAFGLEDQYTQYSYWAHNTNVLSLNKEAYLAYCKPQKILDNANAALTP